MFCLWCHEEIIPDITWKNVFQFFGKDRKLCEDCQQKLPYIEGPVCPTCSKPTEHGEVCRDCRTWTSHPTLGESLIQNVSVFSYTPFMKDIMAKWKYRGDYELVNMFKAGMEKRFKDNFHKQVLTLVPIPLSKTREQERGFNQAEALAGLLGLPMIHALARVRNEKQAKKSRAERLQSKNPFQLKHRMDTPVLLIDDLYTTGTTLHWAAFLLKSAGCPKVYSFTLIRS